MGQIANPVYGCFIHFNKVFHYKSSTMEFFHRWFFFQRNRNVNFTGTHPAGTSPRSHRLCADSGLIGNRVGPKVGYPAAEKKPRDPWGDCIFTYMDGWFLWCSLVNIPLYTWILCLSGVKTTKKHHQLTLENRYHSKRWRLKSRFEELFSYSIQNPAFFYQKTNLPNSFRNMYHFPWLFFCCRA